MGELPPPDVMDQSGRAKRLVLALLFGIAAAAAAFAIASALTADSHDNRYSYVGGATKFVFYMTGFAGAGVFGLVLSILNARAKKKWREELVAQARVVK